MAELDMVFDTNGNPAYCGTTEETVKWLRYRLATDPKSVKGFQVRTGWPHKFPFVEEYLKAKD